MNHIHSNGSRGSSKDAAFLLELQKTVFGTRIVSREDFPLSEDFQFYLLNLKTLLPIVLKFQMLGFWKYNEMFLCWYICHYFFLKASSAAALTIKNVLDT